MRYLGRGLAVVVALVGLLWPVVLTDTGAASSPSTDPVTITDLDVAMSVDAHGTLRAVENVTADVPEGRHGIYRYWDVADASDPHARAAPYDIAVSQDNGPATVQLSWSHRRRYRVARIGDPDTYLAPGQHRYRISYKVDGVLSAGPGDGSTFYWDVVADWEMPIRHAQIAVHLPGDTAGPGEARCAVGAGLTGGCRIDGVGGRDLQVSVDGLAPRVPVTIKVPVSVPAPDRVTLPWTPRFDSVLSRSVPLAIALVLLSALGAVLGLALGWRSHETSPGLPLQYTPPEGVGPVQAAYVVTEKVPHAALAATLTYMAQQGLATVERSTADTWTVTGTGTREQWGATDAVTVALGAALGVTRAGASFTADGSVSQGKELQSAKSVMDSTLKSWARTEGLMRWSVSETVGRVLVIAAIVLAGVGFTINPFEVTLMGAPFAAFAIGGFVLVLPGAGTRRTAKGRELWSRAGGFERILSTPSSKERFDFSGREELYTAYIPWAVAFGCASEWQRKYETEMGQPAPTPVWLGGAYGWGDGASVGTVLNSFESSLSSSISAYQASQSSSSGGGFSGGGGGGGGGGGSW